MTTQNHDLGTLESDGGRHVLTFTRRLRHSPEKVWQAITEQEHLKVWFPQRIDGEMRAGAALRFVDDESNEGFDGEMRVFDPPKVMEMLWGTDVIRLELEPDGNGTMLTLVDTFSELGKAARDGAGWHECLDRLGADLDGTPPPRWSERWREVHPQYVSSLGPEASAIGPPPGWAES